MTMTSVFFLFIDRPCSHFLELLCPTFLVARSHCRLSNCVVCIFNIVHVISTYIYAWHAFEGSHDYLAVDEKKRSGDNTHPCLTPLFMSWKALKSFPILIAAVCSQYIFRTVLRSLPSMSKLSRIDIISSCFNLSKAFV